MPPRAGAVEPPRAANVESTMTASPAPSQALRPRLLLCARAGASVRALLTAARDDFRAHRLRIGTRPLAPGEAEALALARLRPGPRPGRARGARGLGRSHLGERERGADCPKCAEPPRVHFDGGSYGFVSGVTHGLRRPAVARSRPTVGSSTRDGALSPALNEARILRKRRVEVRALRRPQRILK
jgi:hypothetical protein